MMVSHPRDGLGVPQASCRDSDPGRHRRDHGCAGKVVVLTVLRFTDDARAANRVDAVMPKLVLIDELATTVHRLLPVPGVFH